MKINSFNKFQKWCNNMAIYPGLGKNFTYPTLGLIGEAGEVANKVKKIIRDKDGKLNKEDTNEIASELGDVLWYTAQLSTELGIKFSDVVDKCYEKLESRRVRGKLQGSGDNR